MPQRVAAEKISSDKQLISPRWQFTMAAGVQYGSRSQVFTEAYRMNDSTFSRLRLALQRHSDVRVAGLLFVLFWGVPASAQPSQPPSKSFSNAAKALPFPPDARNVEFDTTFKDIEYTCQSSPAALAEFYRKQMATRGWSENADAARVDDDSIELTFRHGEAEVTIEFDQGTDEVDVSLDCEGLTWEDAGNPEALAAAGVPQPEAHIFLQRNLPRPKDAHEIEFEGGECKFKSLLAFEKAYDWYIAEMPKQGWQEVSSKRFLGKFGRKSVFRKGPVILEIDTNKNHQGEGSRIAAKYSSSQPEREMAPLAVAGAPAASPRGPADSKPKLAEVERQQVVDVSKNKGKATVTVGQQRFVLTHVAAFQEEDDPKQVNILFCDKPIPYAKLQQQLAKEDSVSILDLYGFASPVFLVLRLSENYTSFSYSAPGVGIGQGIDDDNLIREVKPEGVRVSGRVALREPDEIFDEPFHVETAFDSVVLRPDTSLGAAASPAATPQALAESEDVPLPEGVSEVQRQRTRYREAVQGTAEIPFPEVVNFYRTALPAAGWKEGAGAAKISADTAKFSFQKPGQSLTVTVVRNGEKASITAASRNEAAAKRDGLHPESGKAKLILGNAHTQNVVITIGTYDYQLRAGEGGSDPKSAKNFTVAPGKYTFTLKIPGQAPETETIEISADGAWGILALPTGGFVADQLY